MHVESVAWVSERKDVLSTLFWLLTMLAYLRWARGPGDGGRGVAKSLLSVEYLLIVLAFLFGLASKPMVVTLPFVLLLLDHWPLGRLNSIREVLPHFLKRFLSSCCRAASSYITIRTQSSYGAVASTSMVPLSSRLENAAVSYAKYIGMLFYPAGSRSQLPLPVFASRVAGRGSRRSARRDQHAVSLAANGTTLSDRWLVVVRRYDWSPSSELFRSVHNRWLTVTLTCRTSVCS